MWHGVDLKTGERAYGTTLKSDAVTDAAFHAEFHNVDPSMIEWHPGKPDMTRQRNGPAPRCAFW
jgi:hypothetical protein